MELELLTDSRSLSDPRNTIFFALRTATGDGHRYIADLYRRGVRRFVVGESYKAPAGCGDAEFVRVDSPLGHLQQMAAQRRSAWTGRVIAVTGSKGKTVVKEWLAQLLGDGHTVCRSPRSHNSQTGVPLSVWRLEPSHDLGIFEAGISRTGEMVALREILAPDIVVITSFDDEHDAGFASRLQKAHEKMLLARKASVVIYPADSPELAVAAKTLPPSVRQVTFDPRQFSLPLANLEEDWMRADAAACAAVMREMGYDEKQIVEGLQHLQPLSTRLLVSDGVNRSQIIYDDLGADIPSLEIALDFAHRQNRPGAPRPLTAILSDFPHPGQSGVKAYARIAETLRRHGVTRLIGVGKEMVRNLEIMQMPGAAYPSTEELLADVTPSDFADELVLIKGDKVFDFPSVVHHLQARTHETVLEVNLDALVHNYNFFRRRLLPSTGIVAMVKADAYGAGALEVAKTLQSQGAAYLAVAIGDEGEQLRRGGITMPIMVLNPMVLNYRQLFENHLEPEIFSFESLDAIIEQGRRAGVKRYPIHLKIDSGMHRLGFRKENLHALLEKIDAQDVVEIKSVFSHLATADCLDQDEYTLSQLRYFDEMSSAIINHYPLRREGKGRILRHILNTAGILRFTDYQYDMVRLGIGLYGIPVIDNDPAESPLRPISTLRSVVISLHHHAPGDTVGYGRHGVITTPSTIATIPVGYADGLSRHLGRGRWQVEINGHLCPIIGNICMDLCMVDVTAAGDIRVGDPVTLIGPRNPATHMAATLATIPYEILTSVSPRVRRTYYRE